MLSIPALLVILSGALPAAPAGAIVNVTVGLSVFYDELAPYGRWMTLADYGEVWCPDAPAGWQPYLDGKWLYTDYGWTWVSTDRWGGDPYHYGTWVFASPSGWVWIPGTVWAPAWVTWCIGDDTIGWAPVPASVTIGATGYGGPAVAAPAMRYVVVPTRHFAGVDVRKFRLDPDRSMAIVARSSMVTSFPVSRGIVQTHGPTVARVQTATGQRVRKASPREAKITARAAPFDAARMSIRVPVVAPAAMRASQRIARADAAPGPDSQVVERRTASAGKPRKEKGRE